MEILGFVPSSHLKPEEHVQLILVHKIIWKHQVWMSRVVMNEDGVGKGHMWVSFHLPTKEVTRRLMSEVEKVQQRKTGTGLLQMQIWWTDITNLKDQEEASNKKKKKNREPEKQGEWVGQHPWKPWDCEKDLVAGRQRVDFDSKSRAEGLTSHFAFGSIERNFL